jgi:ABC-type phosphate transport system substrate-binding protein
MKSHTSQHSLARLLLLTTLLAAPQVQAGIAIIAHPDETTPALDKKKAAEVFLGKNNRMADGTRIQVIDQSEDQRIRDTFYQTLVNKNRRQMQTYWINRIFTGRGTPPAPVGGDADVMAIISASPGYIGYIDSRSVDTSVKVLMVLP